MSVKYHSSVIFVKDIEVTKQFYTEVLGEEIELDFGKNVTLKGGLALWEIRPDHIIPERLGTDWIGSEIGNRFELYFETEKIEGILEKLRKNQIDFLHALHEEPWGQRTIRFFDPDRHLVEIGETLETFVKRLHGENMTAEQVSEKTAIPIEIVREMIK